MKIELNKIIANIYGVKQDSDLALQVAITVNPDINLVKAIMLETAKQVLELVVENSKSNMIMKEDMEGNRYPSSEVDKESILNVINYIIK